MAAQLSHNKHSQGASMPLYVPQTGIGPSSNIGNVSNLTGDMEVWVTRSTVNPNTTEIPTTNSPCQWILYAELNNSRYVNNIL